MHTPAVRPLLWYHSVGPSLARLVLSGCIRIEGLHSLQPALLACMHLSMLLAFLDTCTRLPYISFVMWHHFIGPPLVRLMLSGCIRIESSHSLQPASFPCMHLSMLLALIVIYAHACRQACDVASFRRPITRAACALRLHTHEGASFPCMHQSMLLAFLDICTRLPYISFVMWQPSFH